MTLRNVSLALVIGLIYDMFIKTFHFISPDLWGLRFLSQSKSIMSLLIGVVLLLFLYLFYKNEKDSPSVRRMACVVISGYLILFAARFLFNRVHGFVIEYRIAELGIKFLLTVSGCLLIWFYRKSVDVREDKLRFSAWILFWFSCVGAVIALLRIIDMSYYASSGFTTNPNRLFFTLLYLFFMAKQLVTINFLRLYTHHKQAGE